MRSPFIIIGDEKPQSRCLLHRTNNSKTKGTHYGKKRIEPDQIRRLNCSYIFRFSMGWGVLPADCKTGVVIAQGTDPTRLDPDMHRDLPSNNVILHIYDSLIERGADAKLRPQLAESWKIIDGTTVEFKLRKGIKFSNGEPFNAEVVKYNFERVAGLMPDAKKTLNASDYNTIKEVKVINDDVVQIVTKHPDPLLLAYVAKKFMVPIAYTKARQFREPGYQTHRHRSLRS